MLIIAGKDIIQIFIDQFVISHTVNNKSKIMTSLISLNQELITNSINLIFYYVETFRIADLLFFRLLVQQDPINKLNS